MRTTILRPTVAALVAAFGLLPSAVVRDSLHAQAPAGSEVKIDFRAVTTDGQPVTDLKPSEISLKVGGKVREVKSVDRVGAGAAPAGPAPANPPYATNAATSGGAARTVLLVIDDESVVPGRDESLKGALTRLVAGLPAGDRIGLVSVRLGGVNIQPSTDRAPLNAAIAALRGQAPSETDSAFQCRTQNTLRAIEGILRSAPADAPTTVVFMSASLAQPGESMARMSSRTDTSGPSALCRLTSEDFEKVGVAAAGSRAVMHVIQLVDGTTRSTTEAAPGIENLAGVTGGETLRLTGSGEAAADRVLRESSGSYTLAFVADAGDRAPGGQPLELKVTRPGVTTLARSRIALARTDAKAAGKVSPRDMIRVSTAFTDLPIRAAGYASRGADTKLKIIALFEPVEPNVKIASAIIGLFAADGKLTAQWTAQEGDFARSPVTAALTVEPGQYRMRVAAVDSNGRAGTADYTLAAELTPAATMRLSTLVVGAPKAGSFAPQLHFGAADAAAAGYLEIYGVPKGGTVTVMLELAPSEDAPALGSTPAQVVPGEAEDMRRAVGGFSIAALPAGDHVMRAVVSLDGKVVGRAVRTMRKAGS